MLSIRRRPENRPKSSTMRVKKSNQKLYQLNTNSRLQIGEGKVGTDENAFVEILGHAGQHQAYLIFQEYKKISGKTIEQAMKSEMSGELLEGLLSMGTCSSII